RAKDIVELYIMAGVFLLLLYASPAALVLYWTMNNVFSVGKSLIFLRLFPHEKYVPDPEDRTFKDYVQDFKEAVRPCLNAGFWLFVAIVFLFALQCRVLILHKRHFEHFFYLTALLAFTFCIIFFVKWIADFKSKKVGWSPLMHVFCAGLLFLAVTSFGFILKLKGADGPILKKCIFMAALLADILIYEASFWLCHDNIKEKTVSLQKAKDIKLLYVWDVLFMAVLTILVWPLKVYLSSPAETGITLWQLLGSTFPVFLAVLVLAIGIYRVANLQLREKLALISLFLVLGTLVFRFILPGDYGELDKTLLSLADKLTDSSLFLFVRDFLMLAVLAVAAQVLLKHYPSQCAGCAAIMCCCFILFAGINTAQFLTGSESFETNKTELAELPADNNIISAYSRGEKNVVLFVADMFSGGYMERILAECPEYKTRLSGFTWYRNCLAPSLKTAYSMPSIFAGDEYLPLAMNNMPGTGREKLQTSAKKLFNQFERQGFAVSMVNADSSYLSAATVAPYHAAESASYGKYWEQNYWKSDRVEKSFNQGHLFIMLSLFQSSPFFLKPVIYNDSRWFIFSHKSLFWPVKEHVYSEYGFLALMPEVSNANSTRPTFKYFHSVFTHLPYGVGKNGNLISAGEYPDEDKKNYSDGESAYYSAKKFIELFSTWCDWLKKEGLYDNTYIILLSDHGNSVSDNNPLVSGTTHNRLNALLMIKNYGDGGGLKIDNQLMMPSDAHCFYDNALGKPLILPDRKSCEAVKTKKSDMSNVFLNTDKKIDYEIYRVNDPITDPINWKVIR
ncbi:MAG: sulfatase-like hydrolase/transferase, partial [Spirochaetia bacterium]|nr:sulfatase-like hydrolase/transferase [Spirochaetia bacterium]